MTSPPLWGSNNDGYAIWGLGLITDQAVLVAETN
jgi:hypothetical protein